jgi:glucose/arabinose dehydrogenase
MRRVTAASAAALACLALTFSAGPAAAAPTLPANFQDSFAASASQPTSIAFTPDRRMLVSEQAGRVLQQQPGATATTTALDISAKTCSDQERGMMAVQVDPAYTSNHFIYVYYTWNRFGGPCRYGSNGDTNLPVNRVSRFVLGDNGVADPATETVLIDGIPAPEGYHIGADLQFGKDGLLYVSTGDGGCDYADPVWCDRYNDASRDDHVLLGKVLRVTRDGAIPAGNPYQGAGTARCDVTGITDPGKQCQETFASGLRNPFRMAFDPNAAGTRFFINDVGDITWEEIDLGIAGADYGWNLREGPCPPGATSGCSPTPGGLTDPIHSYRHDTGCMSITGGAFVPTGIWPVAYDGAYLYADLVCGKIFQMRPAAGGAWSVSDFATGFGAYSLVSTTFGPSGTGRALYYVTRNAPGEQIRKITYTGTPRGYARPKAASPLHAPLVPAFAACTSPNAAHGGPLSFGSCRPPAQISPHLTVGTPDANGQVAKSTGHVAFVARPGDAGTPADEADLALRTSLTDVRRRSDLADYTGQLQASVALQLTDRQNGSTPSDHGTAAPFTWTWTVPCAGTADTTAGSTCSSATSADAVLPGSVVEGKRAIWELGRVAVVDGGPDGLASTPAGNSVFAVQGVFVP